MKMKVVLLLVLLAILTTLSIRPSIAVTNEDDLGCWLNITSCLRDNEVISCCPIIQQEIEDERDCICSAKETLLQNATTAASINVIFTFCDISDSFQTLCADEDFDSSSAPVVSPDSSSPSSITSSSPAEEPSPPSPTSDETSTPATEVSTPSPDESVPADVDNYCWARIVNCTDSKSESDVLECCPVFKQEIEDERDCFCSGAKLALLEDTPEADSFDKYLSLCKVRESLDALCPSTDNGSTSNAAGTKIPKKGNALNISASNKVNIAHNSVGLLLSSLFIILALSFLV